MSIKLRREQVIAALYRAGLEPAKDVLEQLIADLAVIYLPPPTEVPALAPHKKRCQFILNNFNSPDKINVWECDFVTTLHRSESCSQSQHDVLYKLERRLGIRTT